nr:RNA polymerase subunit sigma [Sedimentibacter sp.]
MIIEVSILREIDNMAEESKTDEKIMEKFIIQNEFFILKCASSVARNYVSKSDDEWPVALLAFTEAVENYSMEKGSFFNFAELVMRRRLIDFIRSQSRYASEISVSPLLFNFDTDDEDETNIKIEVSEKISHTTDNSLKLEIELANEIFSSYGFSFFDLVECSPKAKKTKRSCAKAVAYMLKNPILVSNMKVKKLLPVKVIENNVKIPRKILERHRKYIIAAVEIISGDFPYLADYIRFIREEF